MFALAEKGHRSLFEAAHRLHPEHPDHGRGQPGGRALAVRRGVGPKCAHLALGVACGERFISVDVHMHG
jgi:endonuclease III